MAARGGQRENSGRKVGSLGKATIERAKLAEIAMTQAREGGKKLAKDVLEEFMMLFAGMAAQAQPMPDGMPVPPGRKPDERKFEKWARLAVETAADLAKYQSPTFKAQVYVGAIPSPPPPPGGGKVLELTTDAVSGSRLYQKLVNGK